MRFLLRLSPLVVAVALAAGCGQKGPLFLRDNPPPGYKPPKPASAKPVPYPENEPENEPGRAPAGAQTEKK